MFFSLFIGLASCRVVLNTVVHPKETLSFTEEITVDDQQMTLSLSNLKKDGSLRYRVIEPNGEKHRPSKDEDLSSSYYESEDRFGTFLTSVSKNFYTPGVYKIEVLNMSKYTSELQISTEVYKKVNEANKDVVEIRNLLYSLQSAMDTLGNENYYLRNNLNENLNEARFITRVMRWLIVFPLLTILIGYLKYLLSKQLVKPKGKRFKGLF